MSDAYKNLTTGSNAGGGGFRGKVYLGPKFSVETLSSFQAKELYLSSPQIENYWNTILRKNGIDVPNPLVGQTMWNIAVDGASELWAASGGRRAVTPEQYIGWYSRSKKKSSAAKPAQTRQVYLSDPATVRDLIDSTVESVLGRKATKSEMDGFYGAIQKMMEDGTVTTTKTRTMNGVTENVVTQTAGFSQKAAESMIEEQLKTNSPEDYAQKKSLDFLNFLFGGGQ